MLQEARDSNNARLGAFKQETKTAAAAAAAAASVQAEVDNMHSRKNAQTQAFMTLS